MDSSHRCAPPGVRVFIVILAHAFATAVAQNAGAQERMPLSANVVCRVNAPGKPAETLMRPHLFYTTDRLAHWNENGPREALRRAGMAADEKGLALLRELNPGLPRAAPSRKPVEVTLPRLTRFGAKPPEGLSAAWSFRGSSFLRAELLDRVDELSAQQEAIPRLKFARPADQPVFVNAMSEAIRRLRGLADQGATGSARMLMDADEDAQVLVNAFPRESPVGYPTPVKERTTKLFAAVGGEQKTATNGVISVLGKPVLQDSRGRRSEVPNLVFCCMGKSWYLNRQQIARARYENRLRELAFQPTSPGAEKQLAVGFECYVWAAYSDKLDDAVTYKGANHLDSPRTIGAGMKEIVLVVDPKRLRHGSSGVRQTP
jgi:hypothetical protein